MLYLAPARAILVRLILTSCWVTALSTVLRPRVRKWQEDISQEDNQDLWELQIMGSCHMTIHLPTYPTGCKEAASLPFVSETLQCLILVTNLFCPNGRTTLSSTRLLTTACADPMKPSYLIWPSNEGCDKSPYSIKPENKKEGLSRGSRPEPLIL